MASGDKLWFEIGLRDEVTKDLDRIMRNAGILRTRLRDAFTISDKDTGFKTAYQNTEKLQRAYSAISNSLVKIRQARLTVTDQDDLRRLAQMQLHLGRMRAELRKFEEELKANPGIMKDANVVDAFLQKLGYGAAIDQVSKKTNEYTIKENEAAQAARQLTQSQMGLVSSYDKVVEAGKRTNNMLSQLKNQFMNAFSAYAVEHLLKSVIEIGGQFEVQHIALKSILGDVEQANTMFNEIKQLAVVSPFNFSQLVSYTKQVAAFNIPYEEMYDTTKRLADMSAGLGVDMGRLILAFGQVRSAAVLRGQELRQFTEAGIPMVQALADEFTRLNGRLVTTGEVFELISKRAVPFEMVKKVLWDMTDEGGRFYNMQFVLADTLAGKWSNLVDAWQIMLSNFAKGESLGGRVLKFMVQSATDLLEVVDKLAPALGGLAAVRVGRYVQGGIASMTGTTIDKNVEKAQQLHAIELKRRMLNMQITQEEYNQGMALNRNKQNFYMLLAQEGRLKEYQIARAVQQGKINTQNIVARVRAKEITIEEGKQLIMWRQKYMNASLFNLKLKEIGLSLKTLMGPLGWMSIAIDGILMAATTWYFKSEQAADKMNEAISNFSTSAKDRQKELADAYKSYNDKTPSSDEEYKNSINAMKEQLKQYDANYASIMREVDGLGTLQEKYEKLKEELGYVAEGYDLASDSKADFERLYGDTEGLNEAAKDWTTANDHLNRSLNVLAAEGTKNVEKAIDELAAKMPKLQEFLYDENNNRRKTSDILRDFADRLTTDDIQRLRQAMGGYYSKNYDYRSVFEGLDKEDKEKFEKYLVNARNRMYEYDKNISSQIDKIVNDTYVRVAAELGEKADHLKKRVEKSGNDLDQKTKTLLRNYFSQQMSAITDGNQSLMRWVDQQRWTLYFHYDIVTDYKEKTGGLQGIASNAWDRINSGGGAMANPKGHTGFSEKDLKDAFGASGNDVNNAKKVLSQQIKNQQNVVNALKTSKDATEEQKKEAKSLFDAMQSDWNTMFTDDWQNLDSKGNPKKGGDKKDVDLERVKNRVELYKKFYSELLNARKIYGQKAAEYLKNSGFADVFSKGEGGWNLSDFSNYSRSIDDLTKTLADNSEERHKFLAGTDADKVVQQRKDEADAIKDYVSELQRLLGVMTESYDTYKKWVELTGDEELSARIAGVTQNTSYSDFLTDLMTKELGKAGYDISPAAIFGLSEKDAKKYGQDNVIFKIWEEWQKNQKKLKKETWDMYEEAIKGAKDYDEKIADINRELTRQIGLINQMDISPAKRTRLIEQANKEADQKKAKANWEKFKEDNNWGEIFANLDRISNDAITNMLTELEKVAPTIRGGVEETKALYEAMEKLRAQQDSRNPFAAISRNLKDRSLINQYSSYAGIRQADANMARILGVEVGSIVNFDNKNIKNKLKNAGFAANKDLATNIGKLGEEFKALQDVLKPVIDLFDALGNKTLSGIFSAGSNALGAAANTAGAFSTLSNAFDSEKGVGKFLKAAGPWGAVAAAGLSIVTSAIGMFGADYADYNKMKEQYEGLINVWDDLIDRKKEYLSESWGTEAKQAGKEALELYKSEIEQTKVVAQGRLDAGSSLGSHSMEYRMWQGSYGYNGKNWKDVASEISRALGGVKFSSMADMLNMTSEQLLWIKTNYAGLWAHMDSDFKEYLDKLIQYGDAEKDLLDEMQEKLTGMDYEDMVSNYGSALSQMENDNKALGENLEDNLKNAILNAMVANVYGERIKELIKLTNDYGNNGDKVYDEYGKVLSEYTAAEYAAIKAESDALNKDMEASRDYLKNLYGWTDGNGSGSTNAIGKAITEQDTSLWSSYLNAIRLDVSVQRVVLENMYNEIQKGIDIPESVKSQLRNLEVIAEQTKRNADAAEAISRILKGVAPDGTYIKIK